MNAALRISLKDEFLNEMMEEFSKYNIPESSDTTDALVAVESEASMREIDIDIDDNINQQMLKMDNPFLMKAFEDYLPVELYPQSDTVDARDQDQVRTIGWGRSIFQTFEKISPTAVLPFRKVLENTLEKVLEQRYSCASKSVKDILVKEYKLEAHLKLMRSVYMMERGHVMTQFYSLMFSEVKTFYPTFYLKKKTLQLNLELILKKIRITDRDVVNVEQRVLVNVHSAGSAVTRMARLECPLVD